MTIAPTLLCIGGPLTGTRQDNYGPGGIGGFLVTYGGRRIFEAGRYRVCWTGLAGPVLMWHEYPMSLEEAVIIHDEWQARDDRRTS